MRTRQKLQKLEKQTYSAWMTACRVLDHKRRVTAKKSEPARREHEATMTLLRADADRAFNAWANVCEIFDELEAANGQQPNEA